MIGASTRRGNRSRRELLRWLEQSAANWQCDIRDCERRAATLSGTSKRELTRAIEVLKDRWRRLNQHVEELHGSSDNHLEGAWERVRRSHRALTGLGQRVCEQSLLSSDRSTRPRYFLSPAPGAGWQLKREGERNPLRQFDEKVSALAFSTRYVRQRAPSELFVRRQDGTFQQTRTYDAVARG